MASTQTRWHIAGDFLENCNCTVVYPCTFSPNQPLTSVPTQGACEWAWGFHIMSGSYGNAHPFSPKLAMAVGDQNSTWADYGMSWDNSGKNGHYAAINWSNA